MTIRFLIKILLSKMGVKMKFRIIKKNSVVGHRESFPKNRFNGLWSSQRPPVSLGVKFKTELIKCSSIGFERITSFRYD